MKKVYQIQIISTLNSYKMRNRRRFDRNAVASSDGIHTRVSHDRRANTTGRTTRKLFAKCGSIKLQVTPMQAAMLASYQLISTL